MKRFLRRSIFGLVPATLAALLLGVPAGAPSPGLNLQDVNLACNDGTNLALTLDVAAAGDLSDAVSAINLYPAGDPALTCSLTQTTSLTSSFRTFSSYRTFFKSSSGGNPNVDYAVGGGRAAFVTRCTQPGSLPPTPQDDNFALNARVDQGAPANTATGTFNITIPKCTSSQNVNGPTTYNTGSHLGTKVDCLIVVGTDATLTATVVKATNLFANPDEVAFPPSRIAVHVHDSGMPGGVGDTIDWTPIATSDCQATGSPPEPLDNGNVHVNDAT